MIDGHSGGIGFLRRLLAIIAVVLLAGAASMAAELKSPDGKLAVAVEVKTIGQQPGCLVYGVTYAGKPVLVDSLLGLTTTDGVSLDSNFAIVKSTPGAQDITWKPLYGERSSIRDHYNEMILDVTAGASPGRQMQIKFRAYDEGIAFCYAIPKQPGLDQLHIASERTQFRFTDNHTAWAAYSAQGTYSAITLDKIKPNCERPLPVRVDEKLWVAVAEARLVDYARMRLQQSKGVPHALEAMLGSDVQVNLPYATPWRVVMVADTPGALLEHNYLILNLNDPQAIEDTSWIKPGKCIREVTLTTEGGKACVDFAVAQNIQYVEYDAGWYGFEYDAKSDARGVHVDPKRYTGKPLNLQEVIDYANSKGIGIILYVNHLALEKQADEVFPLYRSWGVKGVKFGFVNVGSQKWTAWLHDAIRKAAANHLMVDVHDEYRTTGYTRTYPNLMTVEGIGGNETMPTAQHNCTLPFSRFVAGSADATICWYCTRIKTSHAHQLAMAVIVYSPWQFVYWYDRPAMYRGERETELFKFVPTVWDETRALHGRIGEYASLARRSGREWYVGTINAQQRRQLPIALDFLEKGTRYKATVYSDAAPDGSNSTAVTTQDMDVDCTSVIKADLSANGGQAIRIVPAP